MLKNTLLIRNVKFSSRKILDCILIPKSCVEKYSIEFVAASHGSISRGAAEDGLNSSDGPDSSDGTDGTDGTDGPDGTDVPDGPEGPNGLDDRMVIYL